jgi:hypothetical protein
MAVRDMLKTKPYAGMIAAVALLGVSGYLTLAFIRDYTSSGPGTAYFSDDDGKTFFSGDIMELPPFERGGKTVVRAHVFECSGVRVVGYLSRYTTEALAAFEEAKKFKGTNKPPPNLDVIMNAGTRGTQVKRPGEAKWTGWENQEQVARLRGFLCPDGSSPQEVDP